MRRKRSIQRSWLYRYRYLLASILLAVIVLAISIYRFWSVPSGLSASEKLSAIASGRLASGNITGLVNAPWLILEALAIKLYGMTIFALRLPALLLVVASILTMMLAIRAIYRPSLAMMGGLLMACSAFTISLGRAGTPAVMTVLLLTLAILLGYYVVNAKQKVAPAVGLALDLVALSYMSGELYIVVALAVAALLHPKSRYTIKRHKKLLAGIAVAYLILLLTPMLLIGRGRTTLASLLAIGTPSPANLRQLASSYVAGSAGLTGGLMTPMLTITGAIMVVIGLITLARRGGLLSLRSYVIISLLVAGVSMTAFNPDYIYLLFIPTILLEVIAIGYIVDKWHGLFPQNPYARSLAILALSILIGSISLLDINRYISAVNYQASVVYQYDQTLPAVNQLLTSNPHAEIRLVVHSETDYQLYSLLTNRYSNLRVYRHDDRRINELIKSLEAKQTGGSLVDSKAPPLKLAIANKVIRSDVQKLKLSHVYTGWIQHDSLLLAVYE